MATAHRQTRLRADGRMLTGPVLVYGDVAPSYRERFEPGSIALDNAISANLNHDRLQSIGWHPNGGLTLTDTPEALTMRLELPPIPAADRALAEIQAGKLTGLSVEYQALRERADDAGVMVVQSAVLSGIGLVREPAYKQSRVRLRRGTWARGRVMPEGVRACHCVEPDCATVSFDDTAFAGTVADVEAGERDLIAHTGGFGPQFVLGTVKAGGMAVSLGDGGELVMELAASAALSAAGVALAASLESSGPVVRPLIDDSQSTFTDTDGNRHYTDAHVTSLLVKTARNPDGWEGVEIVGEPPEAPEPPRPEPPRPRSEGYRGGLYLWL